jgi:hypothetical protein
VEPRAPRSQKVVRAPKRRKGAVAGSGGKRNVMMGVAVGGLAYGLIEKSFPSMPTLPLIGKSGTVALACYFFGGSNPLIRDIGIAAAAIAGYSLGKEGHVSGYDYGHGLNED